MIIFYGFHTLFSMFSEVSVKVVSEYFMSDGVTENYDGFWSNYTLYDHIIKNHEKLRDG